MSKSLTLSHYLHIPAVELQSRKIALISDVVVVEQSTRSTVFSFVVPQDVSVSSSEENLIWWALSFKVQNRFGRNAFKTRDLQIIRLNEPYCKGYRVTSC